MKFNELNPKLKEFLSKFFNLMNEFDEISAKITDYDFGKIILSATEYSQLDLKLKCIGKTMTDEYFGSNETAWKNFSAETCFPPHFQDYESFWISDFKRASGICIKIWKNSAAFGITPMVFSLKSYGDSFAVTKWNYRTAIGMIEGDHEFPKPIIIKNENQANKSLLDKLLYALLPRRAKDDS